MNIIYFTKHWPKRNHGSTREKSMSLVQSLVNMGHLVNIASTDTNQKPQILSKYPAKFYDLNPKKISSSIVAMGVKPNIIIFDSWETQNLCSAFLYSRWNKCPRILQINKLDGLQKWRKSNYSSIIPQIVIKPNVTIFPEDLQHITQVQQYRSIIRSDHYLCGNDFLHFTLKKIVPEKKCTIISVGIPTDEFKKQKKKQDYRPFHLRQNFVYIGDLSKETSGDCIDIMINSVWPQIKKKVPQAQLHIYGVGYNRTLDNKKSELKSKGISLKGFLQELQDLSRYKALIYPCIYSTGLKMKIIDAWFAHTPVITTPIGCEGLFYQNTNIQQTNSNAIKGGFTKQRVISELQKIEEKEINDYYEKGSFEAINQKMKFGGSGNNFTTFDFAESAYRIYNHEQTWKKSLQTGQNIILRSQDEEQLLLNMKQALIKIQMDTQLNRANPNYIQQWKRYLKSPEYHQKINLK